MRPLLPPLACGVVVAGLLYGLLLAAERKLPEPEDPWLEAWIGDGLKAEFRSTSNEPDKHVLPGDGRDLFGGPEVEGTLLRNYLVQNTSVQLVVLPKAGLIPSLPEVRAIDYRFKPKGNTVHYCRIGRRILFVAAMGKGIAILPAMKTPREQVQRIFDSFEETAGRYP
ncbi:MAG: hypothetical protein HY293_09695 [Planctomycetes bacterium]|nr:hypothetical protein [Planctomycetota bacterium]